MSKEEDDKYPYIAPDPAVLNEKVLWIKASWPPMSRGELSEYVWHKLLISNKEFTLY